MDTNREPALLPGQRRPNYRVMRTQAETIALIERVLTRHPYDADVTAVCRELVVWLRDGRPPTLTASKPWLAAGMSRTSWYRTYRKMRAFR